MLARPLEHSHAPNAAGGLVEHGPQSGRFGSAEHAGGRVDPTFDAARQAEPDVRDPEAEPHPPGVPWEAQSEQSTCVSPGRTHERLGIRIATDDPVHDDHVGRLHPCFLLGEIPVLSLDPLLHALFARKDVRLFVVAARQLDDRRTLGAASQQIEVDRANASPDLQHRRACHASRRQLLDEPSACLVEALAPVAARIATGSALAEGLVVAACAAAVHRRKSTIPRVRILVAEDETIIRLDLKELLERSGFDVCAEAKDGLEAVELARSEQPDLAVLDVKMPRLDGIEAARRILDERPIPIVMLTAYGQDELVSRAIEAGVFGYLVKPFREQDLLPAIRTARARHEELSVLREQADSLAEALAARKSIERARGLLMEREGLSEDEAFSRLRKASQLSGRPMRVVAEALIATFDDS